MPWSGLLLKYSRRYSLEATLESLAYQTRDLVDAMEEDMGREITFLKVDGGASGNNFLLQFQADILGKKCIRPKIVALGAAYFASAEIGRAGRVVGKAESRAARNERRIS